MLRRLFLTVSLLAPMLGAQTSPPSSPALPPLIDRELFFGNPEIVAATVSPDGKYLAFAKPWKGVLNVWVKRTEEPFSAARLLTAETLRPVGSYMWTRDSKSICFVKDNNGDENFNLFLVEIADKPVAGADAPVARNLTGVSKVAVRLYSLPKSDPDAIYIGINDRDPAWHDLYKVKLSNGEKTLIRKNEDKVASWIFDTKGNLRMALRMADNGDQELLRVDTDGLVKVYSCNVFESCAPMRFAKDGKKVYIQTNKGDETDLAGLALLDPQTGKAEMVESDPLKQADFGGAAFSEATDELAFTVYTGDKTRRYYKDKSYAADFEWLAAKLPGKEIGINSASADDRIWVLSAYSDTEPGEAYLFDRKARTLALQFRVRDKLPRESLSPMQPIRYPSSDGMEIPAYLTLPKGAGTANLPLIVVPHGGPWMRDAWGYNSIAQFLANRGYAVLMPNYRGSTGYGKKFLNAGNGEWGRKMQDDLTWGVKYLIAKGTVDAKRVGILGGSYGGYAVLVGITANPELYKAAVDIVGPSNLSTMLGAIPAYWEAQRKMLYARMADPATPAGKAWLRDRSPLYQAEKIKTALLVAQGANDPRVNKAEADQIVAALRDRNFPVEYLLAPDEGHGFVRPVNSMAMFMAAEKFLAKHLGGRAQDGGSPEVVKRLAEITVDPKTVKVAAQVEAASLVPPKPSAEPKPGEYKYSTKLIMNGQEFPLTTVMTIKEENGAWTMTEAIDTPMGAAVDTAVLEKGTLSLRKRAISQGPVKIELEYTNDKASGTMTASGQTRPISAPLDGPLFADAAGSMQSIGCLPLADGYRLVYRNFDVQRQKVKLMQLAVAGSEAVSVAAGKFDTYRVELTAVEGGTDHATVWIDKQTRQPVKMSTVSSVGASMTSELTK